MNNMLGYLRDYKRESVLAPLFKMLEATFDLFVPLVMADIVNVGIAAHDLHYILVRCGILLVLTVIGLGLGNLLGGMVLVETIFNWPGVGQFAYESVLSVDYPSIIGVALLIALNYMVINTVVDILYGVIDPRVRCNG